MTLLTILLGGVIGVFARFCCLSFLPMASFFTILIINAVGSFIIGYTFKLDTLWPFLAIGFCGAFTTFSTYSFDTVRLIIDGHIQQAVGYVFLMNIISICFCWVGVKIVNA